jgi:hypothetical protein
MEYKGVEYSVVQLLEGIGWRWKEENGCNTDKSSIGNQAG